MKQGEGRKKSRPISLQPLSFDEALRDLLAIDPATKRRMARAATKKNPRAKRPAAAAGKAR